jgi:hypothetical protein
MPARLLTGFDQGLAYPHLGAGDTKYALHHPDRHLYVLQSAHAPGTGVQVQSQQLDVELADGRHLPVGSR